MLEHIIEYVNNYNLDNLSLYKMKKNTLWFECLYQLQYVNVKVYYRGSPSGKIQI